MTKIERREPREPLISEADRRALADQQIREALGDLFAVPDHQLYCLFDALTAEQ